MKIKVFSFDSHGKVSFTQEELAKLLNEVYEEGKHDCEATHPYPYTWTCPFTYLTNTGNSGYPADATITHSTTIFPKATFEDTGTETCECECESHHDNIHNCDCKCHKSSESPVYSLQLSNSDAKLIEEAVKDIVANAKNVLNSDDPFRTLAKELNF